MSMETDESPERRKARIRLDEAKNRQTTHWDVDILPKDEVDALYRAGRWRRIRQQLAFAALAIAVLAVAGAITWWVLESVQ